MKRGNVIHVMTHMPNLQIFANSCIWSVIGKHIAHVAIVILHETKLVTLWTQNGSIRQLGKLQGNVFLEKWNPVSVSLKLFLRAKFKRQPNYNLKKKIFKVFYWFRTCFRLNVTKSFFNKKMAFKKCNNVLTKQKLSLKAYLRECYKIGSLKNI